MERIDAKWGRVLVPLLTCFDRDFAVDYKRTGELALRIVNSGFVDTIIVGGTTGEFHALTLEERLNLYKSVKETIGNKCPILAGTGAASTMQAITLTKEAEKIGIDGVMVITPYYCKPTPQGIFEYYKLVASSTNLPVMIYNVPIFTGVNVSADILVKLAKIKNVVGIKDETAINPAQVTEYILRVASNNFAVYTGDDIMVLAALAQGAVGVVSGGSHLVGDKMKKMIELFLKGEIEAAKKIHYQLYPLFTAFSMNGRIHPVPLLKAALKIVGFDPGLPRPPLVPATADEVKQLKKVLKNIL